MGTCSSVVSDEELHQAVVQIQAWETERRNQSQVSQALRVVRGDSFKRAATELRSGLVEAAGGPAAVLKLVQTFYRKLFACAETKHFWAHLSEERQRRLQLNFMKYLLGGPCAYAGSMRLSHLKMVTEQGLDLAMFNKVAGYLVETLAELDVPQTAVNGIMANAIVARDAIFTPAPEEFVKYNDLLLAVTELDPPVLPRLGGAHLACNLMMTFYTRLYTDQDLKYFFTRLLPGRAQNMQLRFMAYVLGGPSTFAGNMRCVHAQMVCEQGLTAAVFDKVAAMLVDAMRDHSVSQAAMQEVLGHVASAKAAIFTALPGEDIPAALPPAKEGSSAICTIVLAGHGSGRKEAVGATRGTSVAAGCPYAQHVQPKQHF